MTTGLLLSRRERNPAPGELKALLRNQGPHVADDLFLLEQRG
jgi:hypothetical protein